MKKIETAVMVAAVDWALMALVLRFLFILQSYGGGAIMLMPGFIEESVPQFNSIVKSCGSELVIMEEDPYGISKGAALMCIQK